MNPLTIGMIGPDLDARGGISTVSRTLVEASAGSGLQIEYFGSMREGPALPKALGMVRRQARLAARLAAGWRPDVWHIHLSYFASFYRKLSYAELVLPTGRPLVLHLHAPDLEAFHAARPAHAAAMQWLFRRASRVIALSGAMSRTLQRLCGAWLEPEVIYNPVALPAEAPPPDGSPTLLFLGEIGDRKGAFDLLAALPALRARHPRLRAIFAGNGEVERLRAEADRLGLAGAVELPGWVDAAARAALLRRCSLFCLPSHHEGLPMSVLEAMAAGRAVLSTPIAGIPEAVDEGQTGLLVPPGQPAALGAALDRLLADPDGLARMGRAGRDRAARLFSTPVIFAALQRLWAGVARHGPA